MIGPKHFRKAEDYLRRAEDMRSPAITEAYLNFAKMHLEMAKMSHDFLRAEMADFDLTELPAGATRVSKSWDEVFYGEDSE